MPNVRGMLEEMSFEQLAEWMAAFRRHGWGETERRRRALCEATTAFAAAGWLKADVPFDAFMPPDMATAPAKQMTPEQEKSATINQIKHMKASALAKHLGEQGFTHEEIATALAELFK